jgi:hypothetical protein
MGGPPPHPLASIAGMKLPSAIVAGACAGAVASLLVTTLPARTVVADAVPANDLGPADRLLLSAQDGKEPLAIVNRGGAPGWGKEARAWNIGALHVSKILNKVIEGERYKAERDAITEEERKGREDFDRRFAELREKYGQIKPDSPERADAEQAIGAFRQEFEIWSRGMREAQAKLFSEQYDRAYKDVREATQVVSDRQGIDMVVRFIPPADALEPGEPASVFLQLQARTFVTMPESIDLTQDVAKELNITLD